MNRARSRRPGAHDLGGYGPGRLARPALGALKPFLWLALAAFVIGFMSYVVLGGVPSVTRSHAAYVPVASPPAADDWNLPKRV